MARKKEASERSVGRPPMEMPDMIPDTPTNVAREVLTPNPRRMVSDDTRRHIEESRHRKLLSLLKE